MGEYNRHTWTATGVALCVMALAMWGLDAPMPVTGALAATGALCGIDGSESAPRSILYAFMGAAIMVMLILRWW